MPDLSTTMIEFTPWDAEIPTVPADQATVEAMLVLHRLWVDEQPGGVQANFSHMNISGLELQNRMLDYAIFYGTNASNTNFKASSLIGAIFWGTDLSGADLARANLEGVNFRSTNMADVNLWRAQLQGCYGNRSEIKSFIFDRYPITYTANVIQAGCVQLSIPSWQSISVERLRKMDTNDQAVVFWEKFGQTLLDIITNTSPAAPSRYLNTFVTPPVVVPEPSTPTEPYVIVSGLVTRGDT